MNLPRQLNRVVIKEELVELTGHYIKALILQQMIYWSERVRDVDQFLAETKRRHENMEVDLQHGWIYKNAKELSKDLMIDASHQTIRRYLQSLIEDGFISERHNPTKGWDRTMQYRVDLVAVASALNKLGYSLEGYSMLDAPIVQNGQSYVQNGQSSVQNGLCNVQNGDSIVQNGRAIPETTTQITTETTAEPERTNELPARAETPPQPDSFIHSADAHTNGNGVAAYPISETPEPAATPPPRPDPPKTSGAPPPEPLPEEQAASEMWLRDVGMGKADAQKLAALHGLEYVERQIFAWKENFRLTGTYGGSRGLLNRFEGDFSAAELTDADRETPLYRRHHPEYKPASPYAAALERLGYEMPEPRALPEPKPELTGIDATWDQTLKDLRLCGSACAEMLADSALEQGDPAQDGLPLYRLLVADGRNVDWLKQRAIKPIRRALAGRLGVPTEQFALNITTHTTAGATP